MRFVIYIVVVGAALATTVLAAAPSADFTRCIDAHTTDTDWAVCSNQEIERQEADLAAAWEAAYAAMKQRDVKAADALLQEQRAWIQFKDLSCRYYGEGTLGYEGRVLDYAACKASILAERTSDLRGLTKDLSK